MAPADKGDVATSEGALDHKTRLALFKMINSGILAKVHGVISTGKEAIVFHAVGGRFVLCHGVGGRIRQHADARFMFKNGSCTENMWKGFSGWSCVLPNYGCGIQCAFHAVRWAMPSLQSRYLR